MGSTIMAVLITIIIISGIINVVVVLSVLWLRNYVMI